MSYLDADGIRRSARNNSSENGVNISATINNNDSSTHNDNNDDTPSSRTSNAFSYDGSSSPKLEPPTNQPEPSSQLQTPYPIPIASTSYPTLSYNIAQDPIIQQLQSSLRMMTTRIDTIQETTEHRFADMQLQYEKGQTSLQNILKQGLIEMNQHRQEERNMMREIRAHQAAEPPTTSVLVQENKSSTSSLGDPPANNHIINTPTTTQSIVSAPDPPEEITPNTTNSNQNLRSSVPPKPVPNENQSIATPILPNAPTTITTPQGTQTIIVQTDRDPKPMNFPLLTSTKGYIQFRAMCLAQSHSHSTFKTLTIMQTNGSLEFNPAMTTQESSQLFFSTVKALGKESHLYVSRDLFHTTNGYKLWSSLDDHFLRTASSVQSKDNLIAEYENTYKKSDESFLLYLNKVENKLEKLQFNRIPIGDLKTQSYKFLRGLKMNNVFGDILMNFENKPDWYSPNMSLRQIALKAQIYYEEYTAIHNISVPSDSPASKPKPPPKAAKPTPKPHPKPAPPSTPQTPTVPQRTAVESEIVKVKSILKKAQNKTAAIYGLTRDHEYDCPIHPNGKHNLLNCYEFGNICESENAFTAFNNVRTDLGLSPMTDRANRQYPPRFQSDIANNRFPVSRPQEHARRVQGDENPYAALDDTEEESENDINQNTNNNINTQSQSYSNSHNPISRSFVQNSPFIHCRYSQNSTSSHPHCLTQQGLYKAVIDSGASHHMSNVKSAFESITKFDHTQPLPQALMGDDMTSLNIEGYGWLNITIHGKNIRVLGYYVPKLGVTLLSVKQHSKYQGCYFHAENNEAVLAFPSFVLHPSTNDEIQVMFRTNNKNHSSTLHFDQHSAIESRLSKGTDKLHHHLHVFPKSMQPYLPTDKQVQFQQTIQIQKLVPNAIIPKRSTKGSIGYDVASIQDSTIPPGEVRKIPTGLATAIPQGLYLRIAPRSSLALQHITVEGGVVDPDYRGEIQILLKNNSTVPFHIHTNQNIAQFIFENASTPYIQVSKSLSSTTRTGGFGSTNPTQSQPQARLAHTDSHITSSLSSPNSSTLPSTTVKPPASASVNSATPKILTMTKEELDRSLGFRRIDDFIKHIKTIPTSNIRIQKDKSPRIDPGATASII